jgi:hypothetical protein
MKASERTPAAAVGAAVVVEPVARSWPPSTITGNCHHSVVVGNDDVARADHLNRHG